MAVCVRRGLTVVELLVCIAVGAVLMAVLLPSVQQTRATARKLECQNRLKQLGVGLSNAESVENEFPTNSNGLVVLLKYLEAGAQAEDVLKDLPSTVVMAYSCPSEVVVPQSQYQQVPNYRFNTGTKFPAEPYGGYNGFRKSSRFQPRIGGPPLYRGTRGEDITDGLSNTAAISERLVTRAERNKLDSVSAEVMEQEPRRFAWRVNSTHFVAGSEPFAINACRTERVSPTSLGDITPSIRNSHVGYDHMLTPNSVACAGGVETFPTEIYTGTIIPASSLHDAGANVLYCDGSVRFTSESIDLAVWNAVGTRDGAEHQHE